MEIATIQGETREPGSHHATKRLRGRGLVPAVIYGHGKTPETVSLSLHDTALALEQLTHVISLKINDQEQQYLIKDVQYDHLQQDPDPRRPDARGSQRACAGQGANRAPRHTKGSARGWHAGARRHRPRRGVPAVEDPRQPAGQDRPSGSEPRRCTSRTSSCPPT